MHRLRDVLKVLVPGILKGDVELAPYVLLHPGRHADAAWFRKTLQTCRHVHAVTENVATIDNDVAKIDADAELDALPLLHLGIALQHSVPDIKGTAHRFDDTTEFG